MRTAAAKGSILGHHSDHVTLGPTNGRIAYPVLLRGSGGRFAGGLCRGGRRGRALLSLLLVRVGVGLRLDGRRRLCLQLQGVALLLHLRGLLHGARRRRLVLLLRGCRLRAASPETLV